MRVLLLRFGALGTVILLGWIAIAHAQRGAVSDEIPPAGNVNQLRDPPPQRSAGDDNPLRPSAKRLAAASQPEKSGRGSLSDPFGPPNGYPGVATSATSEIPSTGPAIAPEAAGRPVNSRYTSRPGGQTRTTDRRGDRYSQPTSRSAKSLPPLRSEQPAPFNPDPYAAPASSPRSPSSGYSADNNDPEGTGQPGSQQLEGAQSPQVTIQKFAPKEIQVGKPAAFRITVRNTGSVGASEVEVRDQVPRGTRLLGTTPDAKRGSRGELLWTLGTIRPGEEAVLEMQVMPTAEGEIGSVATVHFGADASARSVATRPQLALQTAAPAKVGIGEQMTMSIVVSNPGTGIATGVILQERIPAGLQHPAGSELEYQVGDLKPGESRRLDLPLVASRPGPLTNFLVARADGNLRAENKRNIEIVAPLLDVAVEGPKKRFLERQATYQFSLSNPGTASAKGVELVASLPSGLKFMSANNAGYYEESTRTVHWRLEELPANVTGSVELVAMPVEPGQHAIQLRGTAQKGLVVEKQQPVQVEGIAAILFQVADTADPVEIGGETTYEVKVTNQGSKAASNVRLSVLLPPELQPLAAEGPTRHVLQGNCVSFDGLGRL
ncbi:MAG: DUF11 domain-containing protein, partial [Planctomycetaceae bacterium]|nr:DUF11 domain-containing protein [Planctomycetaceae bacterium]